MIIPRFKLTQDDKYLTINIRAPYGQLNTLEVDADENIFLFSCKPYYLRLNLPGEIIDDERAKSTFGTDSQEFTFSYPKKISGEYFADLDLITKLLTPKNNTSLDSSSGSMKIEVLADNRLLKNEENTEIITNQVDLNHGFGFGLRVNKDFMEISSEFNEAIEINPGEVSLKDRRKFRHQIEQGKFSTDHYLADYFESDEINEIIALKSPWDDLNKDSNIIFTDKELDFLKDLPNIQYKLNEKQIDYCNNGLLDILFAYSYDCRTTYFEGSVESGWTISKLAATLSWLDAFQTPKETLVASFRRSLIYPLYRNFQLSQQILKDLKKLLDLNKKYIIQILIKVYKIFLKGDCCRYIFNKLFITDYIIYMMQMDEELWKNLRLEVSQIEIKKGEMGLNLQEIECCFIKQLESSNMACTNNDQEETDSDDSNSDYSTTDDSDDESESESESDADEVSEPLEKLCENINKLVV